MFLTLPDSGLKVKVWVSFGEEKRPLDPWDENSAIGVYRTTEVTVSVSPPEEVSNPVIAIGKSSCSPLDNFNRLVGRKLACQDLFSKMRAKAFSKKDRKAIFDVVCAQFKLRAEKKNQAKAKKAVDPQMSTGG